MALLCMNVALSRERSWPDKSWSGGWRLSFSMHEAAGLGLYHSTSADDLEEMPLDDSNLLIASLKLRQIGVFS